METKRFVLALSLSMIVFLVYVRFFAPKPPEQPLAPPPQQETPAQPQTPKPAETPRKTDHVAAKIKPAVEGRQIVIETDLVRAAVNTAGGVLSGLELKQYREADKTPVGVGVMFNKLSGRAPREEKPKKALGNVQLIPTYENIDIREVVSPLTLVPLEKDLNKLAQVEYGADRDSLRLDKDHSKETLVLTYAGPGGIFIEKQITFYNNSYKIDVAVKTKRIDGYSIVLGTDFGLADKVSSDASGRVGFAAMVDGKTVTDKIDKIKGEVQYSGTIAWLAQEDKYFAATLLYGDQGNRYGKKGAGSAVDRRSAHLEADD